MTLGLMGLALAAGCRTATRVTEVPRVDLALEGGNRGYLVGRPPEAAALKTTRQMVTTDVEIPSFYKPKRTGGPVSLEGMAPPETETEEPVPPEPPQRYDTYTVQKNDSLWSIAAKVYGKATRWRRIFEANRDRLKSPDSLRAGMVLKIPQTDRGGSSAPSGDEGVTYKK